jgi:hypothetical protein
MPPRAATVGRAAIGLAAMPVVGRYAGERQGRAAMLFIQTIAPRRRFGVRALGAGMSFSIGTNKIEREDAND